MALSSKAFGVQEQRQAPVGGPLRALPSSVFVVVLGA